MSFLDKLKGGMGLEEPKKGKAIKPKDKVKPLPEELEAEGELAIDVYETANDIVIQSPIGGTKAEDLNISIEDDMVTIRGNREHLV